MRLCSFYAIGSAVVRSWATPQPVWARYKLREIERKRENLSDVLIILTFSILRTVLTEE
jgi:hypothetical protein